MANRIGGYKVTACLCSLLAVRRLRAVCRWSVLLCRKLNVIKLEACVWLVLHMPAISAVAATIVSKRSLRFDCEGARLVLCGALSRVFLHACVS